MELTGPCDICRTPVTVKVPSNTKKRPEYLCPDCKLTVNMAVETMSRDIPFYKLISRENVG